MELAQHLNERGIVSYRWEAGYFRPSSTTGALPSSLSRARRMKLEALSPSARDSREALAIADGSRLDFAQCVD